jgi:hypothetical protein
VRIVRRKYTRQNKDIARINSAQAVRIRNLENEVSRLLAENLELRADILNLQAGTVRSQHIVDHVGHIKSALDDKLRELGELVTRLEQPPPAPGRRSSVGSRLPRAVPKSPGQRQRELEELAEQEGRLPIILENKSFPRRTLEYVMTGKIYIIANGFAVPMRSHFYYRSRNIIAQTRRTLDPLQYLIL